MPEKITLTSEQQAAFRNDASRRAFMETYPSWRKVGEVPELGITFWCYDLPDGCRIIAQSEPSKYSASGRESKFFLWRKGNQYPGMLYATPEGQICDKLKELKVAAAKG